ncbi:MAG: VOC family protein [Acidobacteria bacterium]|nr:VOC family protein [Acidobacteriota bacterium]
MRIHHISAVTLAVENMARSVDFYQKLGLVLVRGGRDAVFTTFQLGEDFLNLALSSRAYDQWWGRIVLRVDGVDAWHRRLKEQGLLPEAARDGFWGERYFHVKDPDAHQLSFAELIV